MSFISFLDSIETIPPELRRSFELVKHLDERCQEVSNRIQQCVEAYKTSKTRQERKELMNRTEALFDKLDGFTEDKLSTLKKTYDLVESNIQKLGSLADDMEIPLDMPPTKDEPVYCICHQVSYGEMIACDNKDCHIEWFHLPCVGLTKPPDKKKWYCAGCLADFSNNKKPKRSRKR